MLYPFLVSAVKGNTPQTMVFGIDLPDALARYDKWTDKVQHPNDIGITVNWMDKSDVIAVISDSYTLNGVSKVYMNSLVA